MAAQTIVECLPLSNNCLEIEGGVFYEVQAEMV
jgi:hypothetical protein